MITGLNHITLIVNDIYKTKDLFCLLFDAKEIYDSGDNFFSYSKEIFLIINDLWIALMQGNSLQEKTYNHIAFSISNDSFDDYLIKIEKIGLEILKDRTRLEGEGRSIYFYDYDNHLFELHTGTLQDRLKKYKKDQSC